MFSILRLYVIFLVFIVANVAFAANHPCQLITQETYAKPSLIDERVKKCEKLANQGDVDAQLELTTLYLNASIGWGDILSAEKWARKAAESGRKEALAWLAHILLRYKPDASEGDIQEGIESMLKAGIVIEDVFQKDLRLIDFPEVLSFAQKEAESGDTSVQAFLADSYLEGKTIPQDIKKAIQWYKRLLKEGKKYYAYDLGLIYEKGKGGIAVDKKEALKFYKIIAQHGDFDASIKVARLQSPEKKLEKLKLPNLEGKAPQWVAELYSDGTIDILAVYSNKEWKTVDFTQWVSNRFFKSELPEISDKQDTPSTRLAIRKLDFGQVNIGIHQQWFPKVWYSLKEEKNYTIDRLAQIESECDTWYSLVVQGKQPFDAIFRSGQDGKPPVVVDYITSWDVKHISIEQFERASNVKALVLPDYEGKEEKVFHDLKQRFSSYNPSFLEDRRISSLHVWHKKERQQWRKISQNITSKVQMLDHSFLYQVVKDFVHKESFYHTYYNAWVVEQNGKFRLLKSHISLADMDWKSISYESPLVAAWVVGGELYGLGDAVPKGLIIYTLTSEGAKPILQQYRSRSCE